MYRIQIKDMDFEQIARSGQCFRMESREKENGVWTIAAAGEYVEAIKEKDGFLFSCGKKEFKETWAGYFDLQTDYGGYKRRVDSEDSYLKEAMEWGWGVRILHQDLWEMLVTFLISQNNNITRITGSVKELCKRFGDKRKGLGLTMSSDGSWKETERDYNAFPEPESLSAAGLKGLSGLGLGYRDKYILSIAEICSGPEGREWLLRLKEADYKKAHSMLMEQYGIGRKVADCVCLFGLHHVGAFPVDTHVKQILELYYPQGFPLERYQGYAGILQQYMFYYKINQTSRSKLPGV
ncbi:MAG: 8-oxoguanine DNA glycosylase [Hungatella sp.]|jgi:N-glycosylase/DNA lyase|nr:8-oxoguanine DNA glycosylase [Hungatella sp.]